MEKEKDDVSLEAKVMSPWTRTKTNVTTIILKLGSEVHAEPWAVSWGRPQTELNATFHDGSGEKSFLS